jgi:glycosyltransferase involved in cell wall biosynthesis
MIRVCHIISGDLWAGAEVMAYHLLRALRSEKDLELLVILLNRGRLAEEVGKLAIPLVVIDERQYAFPRILVKAREAIRKFSPAVIHSHRYKENLLAYFSRGAAPNSTLVCTQHGMPELLGDSACVKARLISRCNFLLLARCFHKVVAVSADVRQNLLKLPLFKNGRVQTIHNGIPCNGVAARRNRGKFVIGSCARLVPVKDFPFMVQVAAEIAKHSDEIRFEVAGDGPESGTIRQLITSHGLENRFHLHGFVEDTRLFYSGLDVYLNTSFHEGIPISVLEAMELGLPVVAPAVGGLREIIEDGVDGYLVKGRNPKAFAEKCMLLFSDKVLRADMGNATRRKAHSEFSVEHMARRYVRLYREAAECRER